MNEIAIGSMLLLGLALQHALVLIDLKVVKKKDLGNFLTWYIRERPLKLLSSLGFSIAACVFIYEQGYLSPFTGFLAGFMGDAIIDKAGKLAHKLT